MTRIFISYRRGTAVRVTDELTWRLKSCFRGLRVVFRDSDSLRPGARWKERLDEALARCEVFLPIIGPGWAEEFRRRDPETDWVRREVRTVLESSRPVLIIPVLVAGATMPSASELPEELRELPNNQCHSVVVEDASGDSPEEQVERIREAAAVACRTITPRIDAHLGDGPTGNLGFRIFSLPPRRANSDSYEFRYRRLRNTADLDSFVRLSDAEPDLLAQNPDLKGESRRRLYKDWCEWTKESCDLPWDDPNNRTRSFLMLDRSIVTKDAEGRPTARTTWETIGVSIILPLSDDGERFLTCPPDNVEAKASRLEEWHLQSRGASCFLLDTLIIAQRFSGKNSPKKEGIARMQHHNWGTSLPIRHLSEFWRPMSRTSLELVWRRLRRQSITFLVEPDNYRLDDVLVRDLGFERIDRNEESGPILILRYPSSRMARDRDYARNMKRLLNDMRVDSRIAIA